MCFVGSWVESVVLSSVVFHSCLMVFRLVVEVSVFSVSFVVGVIVLVDESSN